MAYRVMLADDEPVMRKALLTLTDWNELNCEVVYSASNGQEVVDKLDQVRPDILITDIKMPGKSGIDLAKYIWEKQLPIAVIILTGYADFSYAQAALKYNVVDYVIKAGVFDGLIDAVEKAKQNLEKTGQVPVEKTPVHLENLLKAIFDGSLYEKYEIREACDNAGFTADGKGYVAAVLRFRVRNETKRRGGRTVYESLANFFSMVFNEQLLGAVSVERDTFVLVLSSGKDLYREMIQNQCSQIIDMMDNFMQMHAYIGISCRRMDIVDLREAYNEADEALEYSFIDDTSKINFYHRPNKQDEVMPSDLNKKMRSLCGEIAKGSTEETGREFDRMMVMIRETRCSAHLIKNAGIYIQNQCRNLLAEQDKTIYEVTGIEYSISKMIYRCRFIEEFEALLKNIVLQTAAVINLMVNKKKSLIIECRKYMEDNYDKNILVTDIAKYIGASPSYLSRIFKETTGQTIIATMNQMKLERAKEYLLHTDMKIYEIAEALGFENTTYFSHFFKKYAGVSPKDYKGEP